MTPYFRPTYLTMNKDYRSQKPPCSSLTVYMKHAQDLEETYASEITMPMITHSILLNDFMTKPEHHVTWWQTWQTLAHWTPHPGLWLRRWPRSNLWKRHKNRALITSASVKCRLKMLVDDIENKSDWWCRLFDAGGKEKSQVHLWLIWASW